MIAQVLTAGGQNGLLSGNIGFPASQVAQTASSKDMLVMELSSFQLMGIEDFHPQETPSVEKIWSGFGSSQHIEKGPLV